MSFGMASPADDMVAAYHIFRRIRWLQRHGYDHHARKLRQAVERLFPTETGNVETILRYGGEEGEP